MVTQDKYIALSEIMAQHCLHALFGGNFKHVSDTDLMRETIKRDTFPAHVSGKVMVYIMCSADKS